MSHRPGHKMNMGSKEKDTPGSFSEKDTKTIGKSTQSRLVSYSSKKTTQPIEKGYSTAGTKTVSKSTYSTAGKSSKSSGGSAAFKSAYSSAKSSGATNFKFKGKSYNTKSATPPKTTTRTSTTYSKGIKTPNTSIKGSTLNKKVTLTKKPPTRTSKTPPPPRKPKKSFGKTKVGKFVKKVGNIQINLPSVRLPKLSRGRSRGSSRGCTRCSRKIRRTRR
tara:strand:+ start:647 stop:1303 length:657 start_codon:yes stop_codon:yes gene_type:complete